MTPDRFIDIPEEVQDVLRLWRPSPLYRAYRLEKALKTPAKIYYKWEGVSPAGSHKPNTSVPQAYYNMKAGMERIATETGAGQWGSALAFATMLYDLNAPCTWSGRAIPRNPYRKSMMQVWGAECIPSPSTKTNSGRRCWKRTRIPRESGDCDLRSGRGCGHPRQHQLRARFGAEPCLSPPDDHRPGMPGAACHGGRSTRMSSSVCRWRVQFCRDLVSRLRVTR